MKILRGLVVLAFALPLSPLRPAYAACAGDVTVADFSFTPAAKTVPAGTTVTWCWKDGNHSVTFDNGGPDSGTQQLPGATYSRPFTKAGTYTYHCKVHGSMTGSITVPGTSPTHTPSPTPTHTPSPTHTVAPVVTTPPPSRTPTPTTAPPTTAPPTTAPPTTTPPTTAPPTLTPSASPTPVAAFDPPPAKPKTGLAIALGLVVAAAALGGSGWLLLRHR